MTWNWPNYTRLYDDGVQQIDIVDWTLSLDRPPINSTILNTVCRHGFLWSGLKKWIYMRPSYWGPFPPSRLGSVEHRAWWCTGGCEMARCYGWISLRARAKAQPLRVSTESKTLQPSLLSEFSLPGISYLLGLISLFRLCYDLDWIVVWHAFIRLLQIQ